MIYTYENHLKQALAKMLPNDIKLTKTKDEANNYYCYLSWKGLLNPHDMEVRDTELLHLCWMVEETLTLDEWNEFKNTFENILSWCIFPINFMHSTWQQRVITLAKVKGIKI